MRLSNVNDINLEQISIIQRKQRSKDKKITKYLFKMNNEDIIIKTDTLFTFGLKEYKSSNDKKYYMLPVCMWSVRNGITEEQKNCILFYKTWRKELNNLFMKMIY